MSTDTDSLFPEGVVVSSSSVTYKTTDTKTADSEHDKNQEFYCHFEINYLNELKKNCVGTCETWINLLKNRGKYATFKSNVEMLPL